MIDKIISFSIKNKLIIGLMVAALAGTGIWAMFNVNLGAVPDITSNQVQVITAAQGLSTKDVEQFITYNVELAMGNLPGVKTIRSVSRFGLSVVTIVFKDDMGTYLPRQLVSNKLKQVKAKIPDRFGDPFMAPITTGLGEVYQFVIKPKPDYENKYTIMELQTILDWIVSRQMSLVPGIVGVNPFGGKTKQLEVVLDPGRLNAMNISISDVLAAMEKNNGNTGGSYIEKDNMAYFIRAKGLITSLDDIRNTVVETRNGTPVLIKDIADTVKIGSQIRYGAFTKDGHEAVGATVMMLKGANPSAVSKTAEKRMAEIEKSLPEGLQIEAFYNRSELISRTTSTIASNLIEGALIVFFVLVILLGSLRGGLITASVIPLSLLFAFICMKVTGVTVNLMSLGAIDFGIIVDGAVILVEGTVFYIEKRLRENDGAFSKGVMNELAYDANSTLMNTVFFGQIIILIVFAPILFLTGVAGKMFQPMAYTFGFALIGAIILCVTYIPAVSALFLKPSKGEKNWFNKLEDKVQAGSDWLMDKIHRGYRPVVKKSLDNKMLVISLSLILMAGAGFTFTQMGGVFIPQLGEGDIAMQLLLKPGSNLSETIGVSEKAEKILKKDFPEVKTSVARIGAAKVPTDPMPMHLADMYIILQKDKSKWVSADSKEELTRKIKKHLTSRLSGIKLIFSQPIELRFNELLTGVRQDVAVKLFGEDLDILAAKAKKMAQIIRTVPGATGVKVEATSGLPQMTIDYNRTKIAQYGLSIEKVNRYINAAFAEGVAGTIYKGARRFNMAVSLSHENRQGIRSLKNLYIDTPAGGQVPLKEVADIDFQPGPMQISRDNTYRRIYVGVNVQDRDVASLVHEIQRKMEAQLELPPGYYIKYGGAFENLQQAQQRLSFVIPIALALIFILLYFALKSLSQAAVIFATVPLAAIGGIFSLALRGLPFSISAGIGFIVLFGVSVLNGLILMNRFNDLKEKEDVMDLKKRILIGTKERLRPTLLAGIAAIMGFVPMAIATSAGAAVQRPLATVVIGGMISATLLTLIVVPVLYYILENSLKKNNGESRPPAVAGLIVLFLTVTAGLILNPASAKAQQTSKTDTLPGITVEQAVKKAKADYPAIKAARLGVESKKALKITAWDLGATRIFTGKEEVGNGALGIQTIVGVEQAGIDPFSIVPKLDLRREQTDLVQSKLRLTLLQVEKNVRQAWGKTYIARHKNRLYRGLDSLFTEFSRAVKLRYREEAISRLEYLAATNQARQIALRADQARSNYRSNLTALNSWLVSDTFFTVPLKDPESLVRPLTNIVSSLNNHPFIVRKRQQVNVADARYDVKKSNFLPEFNVEYGFQRVTGQSGFRSFQVGISFPLFFWSRSGRAKSAKVQKQIAKQNLHRAKIELQSQYKRLLQEYRKWFNSWQYYQEEALPLAIQQREGAVVAYQAGAINYVAFIQNVQSAIEIELNALDALGNYLEIKARLTYYLQSSNQ